MGGSERGLDGDKRHIIAISDVHLGTDRPTVWFQPELHLPYLVHLLDWVVDQADHVRELVLLGDIVDLWTYPCEEQPPTFADIVATHPAVFGLEGALARVLDALDGAVTYVPGNHDMGVTGDDVALVASPGGHRLRLHDGVPYVPASGIAMAHGHHFTLFNAPATRAPWAPLPVGYFITRAVSSKWARDLAEGETVADLPDQGAPNGIDLGTLAATVAGIGARSISGTVVDFVTGATGTSAATEVVMPDGSTVTLGEARAEHADAWTEWATAAGGGVVGQASALRATLADFDGTCLGWFAQRLALEHDAELVVMGHTHIPVDGLEAAMVDYLNTGFDCPSGPDLARDQAPQRVTFAVIDAQEATGELWAVAGPQGEGGGLRCEPIEAPPTRVGLRAGNDFSCYVIVDNTDGAHDLELVGSSASKGTFVVPPPARIAAGERGRFWLQDLVGLIGSEGSATYRRTGPGGSDEGEDLELRFACPAIGTNRASGTPSFATRAGTDPWVDDRIAHWGRPFAVAFDVL